MTASNTGSKQPVATLRFQKKSDFQDRFLSDIGIGGFLWDGSGVTNGQRIEFEVSFIGYQESYRISGVVVWTNSKAPSKPDLPAGVGIEFDPVHKTVMRELIHFTSHGEAEMLRSKDDRKEMRIKVVMECEFLYHRKLTKARVTNLSANGLFIETRQVLLSGAQFLFFLFDEKQLRPLVLEGRVVHGANEGGKDGFGVQLLFDSRKHKAEVLRYVQSLNEAVL